MSNDMTVKKLYTEEYIRDTADAIRLLTGSTDSIKVSEFAEAIRTYVNPNDLTNTKKVKFSFNGWIFSNDNYPAVRLTHINFIKSSDSSIYQFTNQNSIISNPQGNYTSRLLDNWDDGYSGSMAIWNDARNIGKIELVYNFAQPIDLSDFDNIEIRFHWTGGGWEYTRNAIPTSTSIDILTGDSEFYTNIIKNKSLTWEASVINMEGRAATVVIPHN